MALQYLCEGYEPDRLIDLVYVRNGDKVCLFRGDKNRLEESVKQQNQEWGKANGNKYAEPLQIVETLEEVGVEVPVNESEDENGWKVDRKATFAIEGPYQRWGVKNANGRIYPKELFEDLIAKPDTALMQKVKERGMTGHLEHPADGRTNLKEIAMVTTHLSLHPDKKTDGKTGVVRGRSELLETPNGMILRALYKGGIPVGVSSRGRGTVDNEGNVKWSRKNESDDFQLHTFDAVHDPSTPGANPKPMVGENTPTSESIDDGAKLSAAHLRKEGVSRDMAWQRYSRQFTRMGKTPPATEKDFTSHFDSLPGHIHPLDRKESKQVEVATLAEAEEKLAEVDCGSIITASGQVVKMKKGDRVMATPNYIFIVPAGAEIAGGGAEESELTEETEGTDDIANMTREEFFNNYDLVKKHIEAPGATKHFVSYKYITPHGAGPFSGKQVFDHPHPYKKGDEMNAPFGKAKVTSVSKKFTPKSLDNADLFQLGKAAHRKAVEAAITNKTLHRKEVLNDYPDLKNESVNEDQEDVAQEIKKPRAQEDPVAVLAGLTKNEHWKQSPAGYVNDSYPGVTAVVYPDTVMFNRPQQTNESIGENGKVTVSIDRAAYTLSESLDEAGFSSDVKKSALRPVDDEPMEPLVKTYTQYIKRGNTYEPAGKIELKENLGRHAYKIGMSFSGPVFTKVKLKTDELYHFDEDTVTEKVLKEVDKFWGLKEGYEKLGLRHTRGILCFGAPGCGKSSVINQVVEMIVERGDVVFYTNSVSCVQPCMKAFREVEPDRKVVIVLEDADGYINYQERDLLNLMDGEDNLDGVLWLATTNYIDRFPPRLLRPGRFDKKIKVPPPTMEARATYLHRKLKPFGVSEKECGQVAKDLDGLSFGHLKEYIASVYAMGEPKDEVIARLKGERHLVESIDVRNDNFAPLDESTDSLSIDEHHDTVIRHRGVVAGKVRTETGSGLGTQHHAYSNHGTYMSTHSTEDDAKDAVIDHFKAVSAHNREYGIRESGTRTWDVHIKTSQGLKHQGTVTAATEDEAHRKAVGQKMVSAFTGRKYVVIRSNNESTDESAEIPHPSNWDKTATPGDRHISREHGDYMMSKEKVSVNPVKHVLNLFYVPAKPSATNQSHEIGDFNSREEVHAAAIAHEKKTLGESSETPGTVRSRLVKIVKDPVTGEHCVKLPGASEDSHYYTDDKQDAIDTAKDMAKRHGIENPVIKHFTKRNESVDEAWSAQAVIDTARSGYGINIPHKNGGGRIQIRKSRGSQFKLTLDHKDQTHRYQGSAEEITNHLNRHLGLTESESDRPVVNQKKLANHLHNIGKTYHVTAGALSHALSNAVKDSGGDSSEIDADNQLHVPYETTLRRHWMVGKGRGVQAHIYRMPSGNYEFSGNVTHVRESIDSLSVEEGDFDKHMDALHGMQYTLDGVHGHVVKVPNRGYPNYGGHHIEHHASANGKRSESYRKTKRKLGDDFITDFSQSEIPAGVWQKAMKTGRIKNESTDDSRFTTLVSKLSALGVSSPAGLAEFIGKLAKRDEASMFPRGQINRRKRAASALHHLRTTAGPLPPGVSAKDRRIIHRSAARFVGKAFEGNV